MRRAWPLVLVLVAGCAALRSLFPEDRPFFIPPEAARVSGAHSQAIAVAFNDWMAELARDKADALAFAEDGGHDEDGGGTVMPDEIRLPLIECLSRPEAYQTWVYWGDAGTSYVVVVFPAPEHCFPDGEKWHHSGGGVIYEIDAKTYEILKKEVQE